MARTKSAAAMARLVEPPDRPALAVVHPLAELVPLGEAGVAVGRLLDRAGDHVADAVTSDQRLDRVRVGARVERLDVHAAAARTVLPLDLVAGPAHHRRAAGEGRDAAVAERAVVVAE